MAEETEEQYVSNNYWTTDEIKNFTEKEKEINTRALSKMHIARHVMRSITELRALSILSGLHFDLRPLQAIESTGDDTNEVTKMALKLAKWIDSKDRSQNG